MTVIIPCHQGDQHQAERLLKWIAELGQVNARCVLFCADDCNHPYLLSLAQCAFTQALWVRDAENIKSNWSQKNPGGMSAAGPNSIFRQIAWFMYLPQPKGPWLFLEPDCVPCRRDWYERLKAEYAACGKPFMGFRVESRTHPGTTPIPLHLSGVAIYPANTPELCADAIRCHEAAFDVVGAKQMIPQSAFTQSIWHQYCAPGFTNMEEVNVRVKPEVCVYHSNKDGSLIPFIRERLGMMAKEISFKPTVLLNRVEEFANKPSEMPTVKGAVMDIYIKTHAADYPWLEWCMKSIRQFATGFRNIIVESPDAESVMANGVKWIHSEDKQPGYLWQQAAKLQADKHTDADFILYMDSDCVFTQPVTPETFLRDGKPIWLKTKFDSARSDQQVWKPIMQKFLGKEPQHEFMRRHPFCVPRWALEEFRTFCSYRHGVPLSEYIMAQAPPGAKNPLTFSEWNCLGFFLHEFKRDKIAWVDTDEHAAPDAVVYQGFTHAGQKRMEEDIAKFREILGTPPTVVPLATTPPAPILTIASAIDFLVSEARKDGFAKGRVLKSLKQAGLVKGGKLKESEAPAPLAAQGGGFLLAVQSYPGGNDTVLRHAEHYAKSGASRIVGIGTEGGGCVWPDGWHSVEIGANKYIDGDHLPRRLMNTLLWCLSQPEDRFVICEYDVLFFGPLPEWKGAMLHRTGGQLPDAKASQFFHNPWCFDRPTAKRMADAIGQIINEGHCQSRWPEASPDVTVGFAIDRTQMPWRPLEKMFTRNSLEEAGALDLAMQAVRDGAIVVHGCKTQHAYDCLLSALNGSAAAGSKAA